MLQFPGRIAASSMLLLLTGLAACGEGAPAPSAEAAPADPSMVAAAEDPATTAGLAAVPQPTEPGGVGVRLREYQIDLSADTVPSGAVRFHVLNAGTTSHMLIVRDDDDYSATPHLVPGDSTILEVALEPGEYRVLCDVRDEYSHLSEGMLRTLVVR